MDESPNKGLLGLIVLLLIAILILGSILFFQQFPEQEYELPHVLTRAEISFPNGPQLIDAPLKNQPSYFYLFTHTEDPFNHDLSEERYWRVGNMFEEINESYPNLDITWTIEFQGSDAKTIVDRNAQTGLVDYLLDMNERGLVEFGYHAHHDPTYNNRPQNRLDKTSTFEETYDALWTWITCEKHLSGGCAAERGGGLEAILNPFGQVEIVTGVGTGFEFQVERSAGSSAIKELLPNRWLGFGLSDHSPSANDPAYAQARAEFLETLTPTHETSSATFWMDNAIRINDDAFLEGVGTQPLLNGTKPLRVSLQEVDGTRSHIINQGIASKYLYTATGTSPTKWGYVNQESPELPEDLLVSALEREQKYKATQQGLNYLVELATQEPDKWKFVSSSDVVGLFTSEDYWDVDEEELYQIALWLVHNWDGAPPNWAYDGKDFYSLTDAFALLVYGLDQAFFDEGIVSSYAGPWSLSVKNTQTDTLTAQDIFDFRSQQILSGKQIKRTYEINGNSYTSTQLLYALAYAYAAEYLGEAYEVITLPATNTAPQTYELLEAIGCIDCLDTSWSLKPARYQD